MNVRSCPPLCGEAPDRVDVFAAAFRKTPAVFAGANADDGEALDQRNVGCDVGDPPRREADDQEAAVEGNAPGRLVEDVTADRIEDDVGTASVRQCLDLFAEAIVDVDDMVRAVVSRKASFSALEAVAMTRAPSMRPRSTVANPTPPAAPWTRSVSPV